MLEFICPDEQTTAALAVKLASVAQTGDVFALYGTLGMGKSVLARAFIQSLTAVEDVPSPTFTLLQTYDAPEFEVFHYDLYRLKSAEEIFELNIEEAMYSGVCLIEWPEKMGDYLPRGCLKITITPENSGRKITLDCSDAKRLARFEKLKA